MSLIRGMTRGAALMLFGMLEACVVPSLGIRLQSASSGPPLPANLLVDRRSEADKQTHYDPQTNSPNYIYIADKDTIPDRMSLFSARLAALPQFVRDGQPVVVDAFDILWDTSGNTSGSLFHQGRHGLRIHTVQLGDGVNGFICTLRASVNGRGLAEEAVVRYGADVTTAAGDPETGAAAQQCLDAVIQQWTDDALTTSHTRRR